MIGIDMYDFRLFVRECLKTGKSDEIIKILTEENVITQDEWIPVSERLPKQANKSYLVTVDYGGSFICSCQRFFFGEDLGWDDDSVIAWQPLPEPYIGGDKNE